MGVFSVRKTTKQFITEAKAVHGNKYDYSKVEYVNNRTNVLIICPIHGEFWQNPKSHIQGHGCRKCYLCSKHKYGIAICDIANSSHEDYYNAWRSMLDRTLSETYKKQYPTYTSCTLSDEWLTLSNFKKWFESPENGYRDGYHLDKDLLIKGNKHYSPQTCCFLPPEINTLLVNQQTHRGTLPIGVQRSGNRFTSSLMMWNKRTHIGTYNTPIEAFSAYKKAKEKYIHSLAEKYFQEGKITEKVYNALMKYEVEITD